MPFLPHDVVETVIDILTQDDYPNFSSTKSCSLVCRDFLPICRKHIFASVGIINLRRSVNPTPPYVYIHRTSSSGFKILLATSPVIAGYIRDLKCCITAEDSEDGDLIAALKKITNLRSLTIFDVIGPSFRNWNTSQFRHAVVRLFRLHTFTDLSLHSGVEDFVIADLPPNLKNFKFDALFVLPYSAPHPPSSPIKIHTMTIGWGCESSIEQLCRARFEDGGPFIDFTNLNSLEITLFGSDDFKALQQLLQHCTGLVYLSIRSYEVWVPLAGLHKALFPSMHTFKHIQIETILERDDTDPYCGIADELESMSNKNVIEFIDIYIAISTDAERITGDEWGRLDTILTQSSWPHLQGVSLTIIIISHVRREDTFKEELTKMARIQFSGLSSRESVSFEFNVDEH
ncbi:hypothetical protein BDN70DRAFT_862325 [Pholiota conissans]|uniref:F-box domain-containing protein n=1 Tax=Pholiota conissans TaxID=109636 RepID=A0A9P5YZU2_9AGAR|nr:hypothetical protein BDN70DRAFT_862325 [Pholiota conissans]